MTNVVGLFGQPLADGEPVQSCVECLEELLEQAKRGEIVGIAYGAMNSNGQGQTGIGGVIGGYSMLGALKLVEVELTDLMLSMD